MKNIHFTKVVTKSKLYEMSSVFLHCWTECNDCILALWFLFILTDVHINSLYFVSPFKSNFDPALAVLSCLQSPQLIVACFAIITVNNFEVK